MTTAFFQKILIQVSKSFLSISGFNSMAASSASASFLQQIIAACPKPESVKIKDEAIVADKILNIVTSGHQSLQVITDFDATLTRYHLNGNRCDSSYGIIGNSLPEEFRKISQSLYEKYYPMETNPSMIIEVKIPHMIEWYEKSHEVMMSTQPRITKTSLQEMVRQSNSQLRDNAKDAVERMSKSGIPLLVLSAGVGNIVELVLIDSGIHYPNVKVISNFIKFDDADEIAGFKDPLIHMYNKNEAAIHDDNSQYFQNLRSRHNIILLGDSLGDANMDHGVADKKTVLKIGFLNAHLEEHLDAFMAAFDIVLLDDQSFDVFNLLLNHVIN